MKSLNNTSLLNIDNYPGLLPEQLLPPYIEYISDTFRELPENSISRKAIDTYIRLMNYYYLSSNPNSKLIIDCINFCESLKEYLFTYAKQKYTMFDIDIEIKGRIKSPVSALNKFKVTINEYINEGKDLDSITVNDLFAFRTIITVKDKNGVILDDSIAIPICYDIIEQSLEFAKQSKYVTPIKTKPRSDKNAKIIHDITIPQTRPSYILENEEYIKDYIIYPKENTNYQSVHIKLATTLTDANNQPLYLEMQIRTYAMNEHAEHGPASHFTYKSRNVISFSRVPQMLETLENGRLGFINMDKAFEEFFNFPISDINSCLSFEFLQDFLEFTNYSLPIGLLNIDRDENGNIILKDNSQPVTTPIQVSRPVNQDQEKSDIEVVALNIFSQEKIISELEEIGSL